MLGAAWPNKLGVRGMRHGTKPTLAKTKPPTEASRIDITPTGKRGPFTPGCAKLALIKVHSLAGREAEQSQHCRGLKQTRADGILEQTRNDPPATHADHFGRLPRGSAAQGHFGLVRGAEPGESHHELGAAKLAPV